MDYDVDKLTESIREFALVARVAEAPTPTRLKGRWRRTGVIFDDFMMKHDCMWIEPDECPKRYKSIIDKCTQYQLLQQCKRLETKIATKCDVLLVHSEKFYESMLTMKNETDIEKFKKESAKYDGVYINQYTFDAAMMSLGCAIKLADAVISQDIQNGFAIVRPPGHHSMKDEANGYCIFNNAAIVARHAQRNRGISRILIIDWDIHHGQGTQSIFYDDPNVLYVSIHRYENGKFWPELIESNFNFTGLGKAKGFNLNVPLNETGCNDADYLLIWFNLIMPIAYEFNPELVIVSAGYDAALGCPEGKMRVKPTFYSVLCHSLMSLADGKVVCLLEGGYNLLSLAEGVAMTLRTLLSIPCPKLDDRFIEMKPHASVIRSILSCIFSMRPQWKSLCLQGSFERFKPDFGDSIGGDVEVKLKYAPVAIYEGSNSVKPAQYDVNGVVCDKDLVLQEKLNEEIKVIVANTDLSVPKKRTLLMFDKQMNKHKCRERHPENSHRCARIVKALREYDLLEQCSLGTPREATLDELLAVHDETYIELMAKTKHMSEKQLDELSQTFDSIYINNSTYQCALIAAGCVIEAVDKVMSGEHSNAFAVVRPPGHHAGNDYAAGFCFFNNVVIGAKYALDKHSAACKKVLIVDYDFHHGDGVQALVQDDERFLYISLHGYNNADEYPNKSSANFSTGSKNIVNIPWNYDRMSDIEYLLAYFAIVLPVAYEFNPDLVLVSSGFDAAMGDPVGRYKVSPPAYGHLVHHLLPLASGRLVACLEGGYNLESISESSTNVVSVLLGHPPKSLPNLRPPFKSAVISMKNVISYHKSNYSMLCLDYDLPSDHVE